MKMLTRNWFSRGSLRSICFVTAATILALGTQAQQNKINPDTDRNPPGQANQPNNPNPRRQNTAGEENKEHTFLKETLQGNLFEVRLGNLAQQKGANQEVKQFGQRLVRDHGESYNKLKEIAQKEGVTWSQQIDQKHQTMLEQLQSKSGEEFDKEFAKHMVKGHAKGVAKYEKASRECENQDLKSFSQQTLPTLRQHLQEAKQIARTVGLDDTTIASLTREGEDAAGAPATGTETGRETSDKKGSDTPKDYPKSNQPKPQP